MTDRELLEFIAAQVGNLMNEVGNINSQVGNLTNEVGNINSQVGNLTVDMGEVKDEIRKTNAKIDHEVIPKITTLFDGYKQNSDKLDRIEREVSKHEEIILRRIK